MGSDDNTKWPQLKILEAAVNELFYQVSQGVPRQHIDWDLLEDANLVSFQHQVTELSKGDAEQFNQALLFAIDRILRLYNFCMGLEEHYDARTKDGIICIQAENLLTKYFAVICRQCITMAPQHCAYRLVSDIGITLKVSWSYLYRQAIKMSDDLSENLRDRLQVTQCNKCSVRGCNGRFSDILGIVDFVGPHCDSIIFKESSSVDKVEDKKTEVVPKQKEKVISPDNKELSTSGQSGNIVDTPRESNKLTTFPELAHAIQAGFISKDGILIRSQADFVRFCISNHYFEPWGRPAFRRIRDILRNDKGKPISENMLAQSYSDIHSTQKGEDL